MPYNIASEAQFRQNSQGKKNFSQLYQTPNWKTNASAWGTAELHASRVILMSEEDFIAPLSEHYVENDLDNLNAHIRAFTGAFPNRNDLAWLSEPQLLRQSKYDGIGYIWAALGVLLRKDQFASGIYGPQPPTGSSRPLRLAAITASASIQDMSAMRTRPQQGRVLRSTLPLSVSPTPSTTSGSSGSLLGYTEPVSRPLVEDATVHLASSVIRFLLNFKQAPSKAKPLTWRDEKITYRYSGQGRTDVVAADDGGVQIWVPGSQQFRQVVLLEAKRAFRNTNGDLHVTDEVLAQIVAQAIAVQRADQMSTHTAVRQNLSITVLAMNRFLRFYTFVFDNDYLQQYETRGMGANGCYLRIHTTSWIDVTVESHRKTLLKHLSAILRWADTL